MKDHVSVGFVIGRLFAFFHHKSKQVCAYQSPALGFSVNYVSFSCLKTKEQGIVGGHCGSRVT